MDIQVHGYFWIPEKWTKFCKFLISHHFSFWTRNIFFCLVPVWLWHVVGIFEIFCNWKKDGSVLFFTSYHLFAVLMSDLIPPQAKPLCRRVDLSPVHSEFPQWFMEASHNNDALKILGGQKRKWLPIRKTATLLPGSGYLS